MQTIWVLYDQLWTGNAAFAGCTPETGRVLMIESEAFFRKLPHHRIKLAFFISAMRHFSKELEAAGWEVDYHQHGNAKDYQSAIRAHVEKFRPSSIRVLAPNDHALQCAIPALEKKSGVPIEVVPTNQFLLSRKDFAKWAGNAKSLRMENHYRAMRKSLGILMTRDGEPEGGAWNFDAENRGTVKDWKAAGAPRPKPAPDILRDEITERVILEVNDAFPKHPGDTNKLWLPTTRKEALAWLRHFVDDRLGLFGPFEDLMIEGEPLLFHSVLSPMLNIGLLTPMECVDAAVAALRSENPPPLASVEGFVRQIIGWREFVNGVYWLRMPEYQKVNALEAEIPLPAWLWEGTPPMHCMELAITQVRETGYNHHIQRLMVLGNYFLLTGCRPQEVLEWFTAMYVDAHEWVMAANVLGMVLHADGGFMASKPYAAGAAYISKMSDYCKGCRYEPTVRTGPEACPFHALYWSFYDRHQARFAKNPRVAAMIGNWNKRKPEEQSEVRKSATAWLTAQHPN